MNDSMSILLASTILALGGFALYMFKSENEENDIGEYDENSLFGSGGFFNWHSSENDDNDEDFSEEIDNNEEEQEFKPRKRGAKTQKNRKLTSSRRRY